MHLIADTFSVGDLSQTQRDRMFALMERHFDGMVRGKFEQDLAEKHWVILLAEPGTRALVGFSTQMLLSVNVAGRQARALFSGDTIIDQSHWGDNTLAHVWGRLALALADRYADQELYWLLISKGYRTYRYLPLFFREFYPRVDCPTPDSVQLMIDALARAKYPDLYDPQAGVIRVGSAAERLRPEFADVPRGKINDPNVQFFLQKNPGYLRGEELCCLAPLTSVNFTKIAMRVIERDTAIEQLTR